MARIVQKYGGSSVSDIRKIKGVARRIQSSVEKGFEVVVVVSAMGNTTNELLGLASQIATTPNRRELDMLVSTGERITMALLAMCLVELGVAAKSLTGSQSGIITDERHADANVVAVNPNRLEKVLAQGQVAIVAGFQGVSREREITTLGRGGSDTTAVVLAAALKADHCEICSDVDGIWSADPRVVKQATKRDEMSLNEALTLASCGAKVLFEDAVRFARDHNVQLLASKTFGPGSGTRITHTPAQRRVAAIATDKQIMRCTTEIAVCAVAQGARVRRSVGNTVWLDIRNHHGEVAGAPTAIVSVVGDHISEERYPFTEAFALLSGLKVPTWGCEPHSFWVDVSREDADEATIRLHRHFVG